MAKLTTTNFDIANAENSKQPVIVLAIDGVPWVYSSSQLYTQIRYDDPGIFYDGTYVYDGLRPVGRDKMKPYINRQKSSSVITQKVEQVDGRSSIETLNINLVDVRGEVTRLITPGVVIPEILNTKVKVYFGYQNISYPEDYLRIFSGYINDYQTAQGSINFNFTDPSSRRKQQIFLPTQPTLQLDIDNVQTNLLMSNAQLLYKTILDGKGNLDPSVTIGFLIDSEVITYTNASVNDYTLFSTTFTPGSPGVVNAIGSNFFFNEQVQFQIVGVGTLPTGLTPNTTYYVLSSGLTADAFQIATSPGGPAINFPNAGTGTFTVNSFGYMTSVTRGAFGTSAAAHSAGATCTPLIQFNDNAVNIALKLMLSGFNGPAVENIALRGIINTDSGLLTVPDSITFGQGVDLQRDYGLWIGDFITLSGSGNAGNNATFTINQFLNDNRTVVVAETGVLVQENPPTSTIAAFRSKYDTYPVDAGLSLPMDDVNVEKFEYNRDTFLPINFKIRVKGQESSGKDFIDSNIMKPLGAYSLTQGARISMGLTHPPLAQDLSKVINHENVVNPSRIVVKRGLNSLRSFYNTVLFNFNYDIVNDVFQSQVYYVDSNAENRMNQISTLQIDVRGLDGSLASQRILEQRANRLLLRYRYAAEQISLDTFFSTGNTIDGGDVVVLSDDPTNPILKIPNTDQGTQGVINRVMEVQERSIDISNAKTSLTLLSNNGFSFSDRYAVFSGSSLVQTSGLNSNTQFLIGDSFGAKFPGQEWKKWGDFPGALIKVHDRDYTYTAETRFSLDVSNPNLVHVDPPLPFVPVAGDIMDYADYAAGSDTRDSGVKATYAFRSSTAPILSGSTNTVFTLQSGYASRYSVGAYIYVMSPDGSRFSPDVIILSIVGDIVTIKPITGSGDLGFVPQVGDLMQMGGFPDGGASYRFI